MLGVCNCSMCTLIYVHSSFAIIFMGNRELVALLSLSSRFLVSGVWLFLALPWVCLQFVVVVFPDHTYLLFCQSRNPSDKSFWICACITNHFASTIFDPLKKQCMTCTYNTVDMYFYYIQSNEKQKNID